MMSSGDESDSPEGAVARETFSNTESNPPTSIEAVRINEVLSGKYYDEAGITWWWNNPNSGLGDRTPLQLWLSGLEPSPGTIEMIKMAAEVAPMMGHAT